MASWREHGGRRKGFGPVGQGLKGGGRDLMPTYVVLINFTDQGIRNVKQTTERTDHGGEIAEKHGLKLEQPYGHHTNHHAPNLRRARDVGHPPEDRLSRPTSENTYSRQLGE